MWLVTYRVPHVAQYIEYIGGKRHYFHASERVKVQPWWSVPATARNRTAGANNNAAADRATWPCPAAPRRGRRR